MAFCRCENHFRLNTTSTIIELEKYYRWTHSNSMIGDFLRIIQENLGYTLFRSIEEARIALSSTELAEIVFREAGISIEDAVKRSEFAAYLVKNMKKLRETIADLLEEAKMRPEDVDSVFLTGGSSLVIPVREVMEDIFGADKIKEEDAFTSVARGLALTGKFQ